MAAKITATVTDIFTEGFVEVAPWEDGKPGKRRCVAETFEKRPRRGDVVTLEPAKPWDQPIAKLAYLQVPALFVVGVAFNRGELLDKVLSGLLLAAAGFVLAWLMNRPARLRRRLEYRVVHTVQKAKDSLSLDD